jgi:hypothetical protein
MTTGQKPQGRREGGMTIFRVGPETKPPEPKIRCGDCGGTTWTVITDRVAHWRHLRCDACGRCRDFRHHISI